MKKSSKNSPDLAGFLNSKKLTAVLGIVAVALVALLILMLILIPSGKQQATVTPKPTAPNSSVTEPSVPAPTKKPEPTLPPVDISGGNVKQEMLPHMAQWYEKNSEVIGYLCIPDTRIDNVVMYTPDDSTKYLYHNIEGQFRAGGELLLDTRCNIDPESPVLMIHGHNMINGTKFKDLLKYSMSDYWKSHGTVYYTTLYEEREYEVFAAFFDEVYDVDANVFKFYEFINPETEEVYNEGIRYFLDRSEFDSGITPEFGERLLMLVTCEYSTPNGRFVVVAREITKE